MIISVLICSIVKRQHLLTNLLLELGKQMREGVEVLTFIDNKENTTGFKRQRLIERAKGEYVIFIDDDDWIEPHYIEELLKAAESNADCFAINGIMIYDGQRRVKWKLSKDNQNQDVHENGELIYLRRTNHITAVKRSIALAAGFPDKSNAEDKAYSERLNLASEHLIEKPMYQYRYQSHDKEYA
jgi:GT2 family glycosyltransferase